MAILKRRIFLPMAAMIKMNIKNVGFFLTLFPNSLLFSNLGSVTIIWTNPNLELRVSHFSIFLKSLLLIQSKLRSLEQYLVTIVLKFSKRFLSALLNLLQ